MLVSLLLRVASEFDDEEEYEESKAETMEQLKQFQAFLTQMLSGDLTLMDEFATAQLVRPRSPEHSLSFSSGGLQTT